MKIILEGPDNSGKTTLAKLLAKDLDLEYRRPPTLSSTKGPNDGVATWWEDQLQQRANEAAVYDRCFYISDPIYRLVSGHTPLRSAGHMMYGISRVKELAFLVFCLPRWSLSKALIEAENADGQGLQFMDIHHAEIVHWRYFLEYQSWFWVMQDRVASYNYEHDTPDKLRLLTFRIKEAIVNEHS